MIEQGTHVEFNIGYVKFRGRICGVSDVGQPVIGITYIIEPDTDISCKDYPYTHIVLPEILFKIID